MIQQRPSFDDITMVDMDAELGQLDYQQRRASTTGTPVDGHYDTDYTRPLGKRTFCGLVQFCIWLVTLCSCFAETAGQYMLPRNNKGGPELWQKFLRSGKFEIVEAGGRMRVQYDSQQHGKKLVKEGPSRKPPYSKGPKRPCDEDEIKIKDVLEEPQAHSDCVFVRGAIER